MQTRKRKEQSVYAWFSALLAIFLAIGTAQAQDRINDIDVSNTVDDQLMADPAVPADEVDVLTTQGIVTLSGTVDSILAKRRAERVTELVKGVRGIINNIEVVPPLKADSTLENDVARSLHWDPATEAWQLDVKAENGMVTLSGRVDSWQERNLAERVAAGVSGVKDITNEITVDYKTQRTDSEIMEDIGATMRWDALVDDALIDVVVSNGHVILTGTVGSLAEKNRARGDAWVAGVKTMDHSGLEVRWWTRDDRLRTDKYVNLTDQEIETAVNDTLLYDPRVNSLNIDVRSSNGDVTLRGTADNLKARRAAAEDARNVVGVWTVRNRIKIRPADISDSAIRSNVTAALAIDPYLDRFDISVTVREGDVYLYGEVDSGFEKAQADDVASRQIGVKKVYNYLSINAPFTTVFNPFYDNWYWYDFDWYMTSDVPPGTTDWEIAENIRSQLFWSPFVDRGDIVVTVDNGIASLSGTVDSWAERRTATENAFEGGATAVDNNLKVNYGPDYYLP
jgi:osmotically-inducible protein OsmY